MDQIRIAVTVGNLYKEAEEEAAQLSYSAVVCRAVELYCIILRGVSNIYSYWMQEIPKNPKIVTLLS